MALYFTSGARRYVDNLICDEVEEDHADAAGFLQRTQDPFRIDNDCICPEGHYTISSCGGLVCVHCEKVFWA